MQFVIVKVLRVTIAYSVSSRTRANELWSPPHAVVLTGVTIWAICSVIQSMTSIVGWPTMVSSGFADMMRLTVV